jgi:hypothetical protein
MYSARFRISRRATAWLLTSLLTPCLAVAGGPKYVAGVSYFNSGVVGQPVHWANGQLNYYVDQGPLNSTVTNQQATAMVDAAAALWSAVATAGRDADRQGPVERGRQRREHRSRRHRLHGDRRADESSWASSPRRPM